MTNGDTILVNGDNGDVVQPSEASDALLTATSSEVGSEENSDDRSLAGFGFMALKVDTNSLDSPGGSCSRASTQASPMRNLSSGHGGLYVSAPGKIILFGEHAVVYGRTAIAGSIDLRTYVSLFTSADGRIYLSLPDLGVEKTWMLKDLLKAAERLAQEYPVEEDQIPSLEILVPIARKLSGSCEDTCGVQHLAILAFWYILLGVAHRKSCMAKKAAAEGVELVGGKGIVAVEKETGQTDTLKPESITAQSRSASADSTSSAGGKEDLLAVKATVRFKLPSCVGLGSSGAYCVCIATALLQTAGLIPAPSIVTDEEGSLTWEDKDLDMIRKWATAAESLIHGRASGLDAAVCTYGSQIRNYGYQSFTHLGYVGCYGGVASFKPGTPIEHLKNLPDLRVILVNSKVERNTSRMVQIVKEKLKKFPKVVDGMFCSIDEISHEAADILHRPVWENGDGTAVGTDVSSTPIENGQVQTGILSNIVPEGDHHSLQELCRMNNQLLIALGVGHPKVDQICTILARYGIHPKMTGAGGGGCVFAFLKPDTPQTLLDMISSELNKLGYEVWQPPLGGPGVVSIPVFSGGAFSQTGSVFGANLLDDVQHTGL
ncbi:hypothetical protein WR25_15498 [Diploscapter pachys]|uniref:GHMP kinase C-terminal domain-containing protein n=1 Tax=Diploscapter pachys TaxID=2018661 RepID=A0A2A2J4H1_9BILA|nr:hypothetical protein WR25_15498 [Diploscapter pachys]